jgi:hypothetical protein
VIGNDGWESSATDIIGIHDYDMHPQSIVERYGAQANSKELFDRRLPGGRVLTLDGYPHRGQPIMLTEFGGIAFEKVRARKRKHWGYSVAATAEDFERRFRTLVEAVAFAPLFSGFCYTQFADTFQEVNGLLYPDRTPKIPLERIHEAVTVKRNYLQGTV